MKIKHNENKESKSNVGLRVLFSEKAFIALLQVILALGIANLQFRNSEQYGNHMKMPQEQQKQ